MSFSLNKAHKFFDRLKQTQQNRSPALTVLVVVSVSPASLRGWDLYKRTVGQVEDLRVKMITQEAYDLDFITLKEAIFGANQKSGVSWKLSRREYLGKRLTLLEQALVAAQQETAPYSLDTATQEDFDAKTSELEAERLAEATRVGALVNPGYERAPHDSKFLVVVLKPENLQASIKAVKVEINKLDEEITVLNATTMVDIEFSAYTKDYLGIE